MDTCDGSPSDREREIPQSSGDRSALGSIDWPTVRFAFSLFAAVATCIVYAALIAIELFVT